MFDIPVVQIPAANIDGNNRKGSFPLQKTEEILLVQLNDQISVVFHKDRLLQWPEFLLV